MLQIIFAVCFCLVYVQGGHVLTPLPAATPLKPGSAVSNIVSIYVTLTSFVFYQHRFAERKYCESEYDCYI